MAKRMPSALKTLNYALSTFLAALATMVLVYKWVLAG
jgi:hypothetical protein